MDFLKKYWWVILLLGIAAWGMWYYKNQKDAEKVEGEEEPKGQGAPDLVISPLPKGHGVIMEDYVQGDELA